MTYIWAIQGISKECIGNVSMYKIHFTMNLNHNIRYILQVYSCLRITRITWRTKRMYYV